MRKTEHCCRTAHHVTSQWIFPIAVRSIDCWKSIWLWSKSVCRPICRRILFRIWKSKNDTVVHPPLATYALLRRSIRTEHWKTHQCVSESHHHHNGWHAATTFAASSYGYIFAFRMNYAWDSQWCPHLMRHCWWDFYYDSCVFVFSWMHRSHSAWRMGRFCTFYYFSAYVWTWRRVLNATHTQLQCISLRRRMCRRLIMYVVTEFNIYFRLMNDVRRMDRWTLALSLADCILHISIWNRRQINTHAYYNSINSISWLSCRSSFHIECDFCDYYYHYVLFMCCRAVK